LGEKVQVLGYPWYGGETITQTEGKISWFEQGYYKIDANLDSWNSWWWAFDWAWSFVWVPTFVSVWYSTLWYIVAYDTVTQIIESTWADWTIIVEESNEWEGDFRAFSNKKYIVTETPATITTKHATISNAKALWFTVDTYLRTENDNWPEEIFLKDKKWKTSVRIVTNWKYDPSKWWDKQHKEDIKFYKENTDAVLTKKITRNWNDRQATYIDTGNLTPNSKTIYFRQLNTTWWTTWFIVDTIDHKYESFVNWILLFLKFTDVPHKTNILI